MPSELTMRIVTTSFGLSSSHDLTGSRYDVNVPASRRRQLGARGEGNVSARLQGERSDAAHSVWHRCSSFPFMWPWTCRSRMPSSSCVATV